MSDAITCRYCSSAAIRSHVLRICLVHLTETTAVAERRIGGGPALERLWTRFVDEVAESDVTDWSAIRDAVDQGLRLAGVDAVAAAGRAEQLADQVAERRAEIARFRGSVHVLERA